MVEGVLSRRLAGAPDRLNQIPPEYWLAFSYEELYIAIQRSSPCARRHEGKDHDPGGFSRVESWTQESFLSSRNRPPVVAARRTPEGPRIRLLPLAPTKSEPYGEKSVGPILTGCRFPFASNLTRLVSRSRLFTPTRRSFVFSPGSRPRTQRFEYGCNTSSRFFHSLPRNSQIPLSEKAKRAGS